MTEDNGAVFRRYMDFWRAGELSEVDAVIGPGYVGHSSAGQRDKAGLIKRIQEFRSLFPDIVFHIEDQIAVGDKVVTRMTAHGTHQQSGERATLIGMNISRIHDGRVVEEWAVWERLSGAYSEYE